MEYTFATGGTYDPGVPVPSSVLGYEVGERFTPHHLLMRYLDRLAATSQRIRLDTVARSVEGREVMMVIVTSEANQRRLAAIRQDVARLADPRGVAANELAEAVARTPVVVWLGYNVHGGEADRVPSRRLLDGCKGAGTVQDPCGRREHHERVGGQGPAWEA